MSGLESALILHQGRSMFNLEDDVAALKSFSGFWLEPSARLALGRRIALSTRRDDPEGHGLPRDLLHLRNPAFLRRREMNVPFEVGWLDRHAQAAAQELDEAVDEVPRSPVAPMDQGILAVDHFHRRVFLIQGGKVRVVLPQLRTRRENV